MSLGEYCREFSESELDERLVPWSRVTIAGILRELTNYEFDWSDCVHRHVGMVVRNEQPQHRSGEADVFDTWQVACTRSRLAADHLESLCAQGKFTDERLRMALLPLGATYARYLAQLQLLRTERQ
ncbi:hypothetical protein CG736_23595 [Kitasatospora sp. CB02891]|nr:hypothetical protein CG736_23595 [Kitasatospora sp. CB02891]